MIDEKVMALINVLGDDAKTAFIVYLICDYGSLIISIGLITWAIRSYWKYYKKENDR